MPTVIDIETIPNVDVVGLLPEPTPDARLKDGVKIAADIEKKKADQRDGMGLDPNFARICVIGHAERVEGKIVTGDDWLKEATDDAERALLKSFWRRMSGVTQVATFNGAGFDIPFIMRRSWVLGVKPTKLFETVPWKCIMPMSNHIDIRLVLSMGDTHARGNLDLYGKLKLGRGKTEGMDGSQVWPTWQAGKIDVIRDYCRDDCVEAMELLESLYGFYLPESK
jgi:predicted PolB exonuclease-like 3'-5' exonuclease